MCRSGTLFNHLILFYRSTFLYFIWTIFKIFSRYTKSRKVILKYQI